jgi:predicted ATP-dependent protease
MSKKELKYSDLKISFDIDIEKITAKDDNFISQERIESALKKMVNMSSFDYNLFISGSLSKNDKDIIKKNISEFAKNNEKELYDYCYVNNFKNPKMPKVLKLKKGTGKLLSKEMDEFVGYLKKSVPNLFESKEYEEKIQEVITYYNDKQTELDKDIQKKANDLDFTIKFSQMGITLVPIVSGKAINEREYANLSDSLKQTIEEKRKKLEEDLDEFLRKSRELEKEKQKKIKKINDEMGLFIVSQRIDDIKEKFKDCKNIDEYLDDVEEYTLNNIAIFLPQKNQQFPFMQTQARYIEYKVNLFVDNKDNNDVPIIYEENPTYYNLFGKLEKQAYFGSFITDFTHIIPGSIHKANGGYLILDAVSVLTNPGVWDTLKKSLSSKKSIIEEWSEKYGIIASETLKPQPVDLDINIVLVGPEYIYDILYTYDEDFSKLFKIKTNFNYTIEKNEKSVEKFAAKILSYCNKNNLKIPDKSGIEGLLKHSLRLSEDTTKMWAYYDDVIDILRESQTKSKGTNISYSDVKSAIDEKFFLKNLWKEKIYEMMEDGTIILDLKGKKIGQINGLSVLDLGDFSFGRPNKITAKTFMGKEGVINIERESKLSGKIFDKASFIISGYIGQKYGFNKTLSFAASISFEQSYSMIEGDSASIAETLALLSSLAEIPIKQNLAVTGSMNQDGVVQPIGGVNEKIEGFYDICKLTGSLKGNGVVIPKQNIKNLILKDEVLESIKKKEFHIYSIETIDDAIEIFSQLKAGKNIGNGFEKDSFHYFVDKKFKKINKIFKKEDEE